MKREPWSVATARRNAAKTTLIFSVLYIITVSILLK